MLRPALLTAFLLLVSYVSAQTTNGVASRVPKAELAKVRKSKYRVVVPTYVPAGFLVKANLELDKEAALTNWVLRYTHSKTKATITIQMASDGLGDYIFSTPDGDTAEPTRSIFGKSPVFGKFELMVVKKPKYNMTATTWISTSTRTYPNYTMVYSDGVAEGTVKRVIEGLRWLK